MEIAAFEDDKRWDENELAKNIKRKREATGLGLAEIKENTLLEYLKAHPYTGPRGKDFKPTTSYYKIDDAGFDMLEHYWEDEPAYADGPFCGVATMRAFSDNRIVGFKIRGLTHFLKELIEKQK